MSKHHDHGARERLRRRILSVFESAATNVLYYDRKEDETLPPGAIETALVEGVVTVEECLAPLERELRRALA